MIEIQLNGKIHKLREGVNIDSGDPQHGVQHMHLHTQGNPHCSGQPSLAALGVTAASDQGEVGAGADDGQDSEQGDSNEFGQRERPR